MTFRVTNFDMHHRRRSLVVRGAGNRLQALAWVEQLYGDAWYVAAVRVLGGA